MKVFGIHRGASEQFNFNKGLFLQNPIEEFLIEYQKRAGIKNEIKLEFKSTLNEKNYFLYDKYLK